MRLRTISVITAALILSACSYHVQFAGEPVKRNVQVEVIAVNIPGGILRPLMQFHASQGSFGADWSKADDPYHATPAVQVTVAGRTFNGVIWSVYNHGSGAMVFYDDDTTYDSIRPALGRIGTMNIYPAVS